MIWPLAVSSLSVSSLLASPKSVTRGAPGCVDQDVGRLEVAMQDMVLMGVLHGQGDLLHELGRPSRGRVALGDRLGQARPLDEPHAEVVLPVSLANFVDGHDRGMVEAGGSLGLGTETANLGVVGELTGQDHLEGDHAIQAELPCLEHHAHATAGDLAKDLIVAEARSHGFSRRGLSILGHIALVEGHGFARAG